MLAVRYGRMNKPALVIFVIVLLVIIVGALWFFRVRDSRFSECVTVSFLTYTTRQALFQMQKSIKLSSWFAIEESVILYPSISSTQTKLVRLQVMAVSDLIADDRMI